MTHTSDTPASQLKRKIEQNQWACRKTSWVYNHEWLTMIINLMESEMSEEVYFYVGLWGHFPKGWVAWVAAASKGWFRCTEVQGMSSTNCLTPSISSWESVLRPAVTMLQQSLVPTTDGSPLYQAFFRNLPDLQNPAETGEAPSFRTEQLLSSYPL